MDINKIEVGTEISVQHSRKGQLNGKVVSNDPDSEWMSIELYNRVEGMALGNICHPGEVMNTRNTFLSNCKELPKQ